MNRIKSGTDKDLLIGTRPLIEAIQAEKEIDKILIQKGLNSSTFKELWPLIKDHNIPFQYVPQEKLNRITRKNHQGIVAFTSQVVFQDYQEIVIKAFERGEDPLILVLDRVTDVRNFGAICRTAECTGVHAILIPSRGSAPINYDALKTSAGALNHMAICREANLKEALTWLKDYGLSIVGCTEKADDLSYETELKGPVALIMGSEENGISPEYLKICNSKVKLPMLGKIGSLNVSVATGALLYELIRQRQSAI